MNKTVENQNRKLEIGESNRRDDYECVKARDRERERERKKRLSDMVRVEE